MPQGGPSSTVIPDSQAPNEGYDLGKASEVRQSPNVTANSESVTVSQQEPPKMPNNTAGSKQIPSISAIPVSGLNSSQHGSESGSKQTSTTLHASDGESARVTPNKGTEWDRDRDENRKGYRYREARWEKDRKRNRDRSPEVGRHQDQDNQSPSPSRRRRHRHQNHPREPSPNLSDTQSSLRSAGRSSRRSRYETSFANDDAEYRRRRQRARREEGEKYGEQVAPKRDSGLGCWFAKLRGK